MLLIEFLHDYPAEGGYMAGMSMYDKYHCWAVTQYCEKVRLHALPLSARPDVGTADGSPGGQRLEGIPAKRGRWHRLDDYQSVWGALTRPTPAVSPCPAAVS